MEAVIGQIPAAQNSAWWSQTLGETCDKWSQPTGVTPCALSALGAVQWLAKRMETMHMGSTIHVALLVTSNHGSPAHVP